MSSKQNDTLIILYTCRKNQEKARACVSTWGKTADKIIVITDEKLEIPCGQEVIPSIGYKKLCEKTFLMWSLIFKKYKKYHYFIKVDDDTLVFPKNLYKKLNEKTWDFFGNAKKYFKKDDQGYPWITGCFYGLSFKALERMMKGVSNAAKREEFLSRGSAEDVSVSVLLAQQGIVASHWEEVVILDGKKKYKEALFNKNILSLSSLQPWQMKIMKFAWNSMQK